VEEVLWFVFSLTEGCYLAVYALLLPLLWDLKLLCWNCAARRETVDSFMAAEFLGRLYTVFEYLAANGTTGGILVAWDGDLIDMATQLVNCQTATCGLCVGVFTSVATFFGELEDEGRLCCCLGAGWCGSLLYS